LRFFNLVILGNIYRAMFALEEARAVHSEAQAIADDWQHPFILEWLAAERCADCAVAGDWAAAYAYVRQRLSIRHDTEASLGMAYWHETEALVRAGEIELAAIEAQRFGERLSGQRYRIPYLRALAVLAQQRGEMEQANAHLREAASLAEAIGLPGELWQLYAELGERQKASEIVHTLAAKIDDEQLRSEFLAAEPIQRVLQEVRVKNG
jgi:hypothetical protein